MCHSNEEFTLRHVVTCGTGLHCAEERYQEDVRHEVHEQVKMRGAERSEECPQRTPDHAEP